MLKLAGEQLVSVHDSNLKLLFVNSMIGIRGRAPWSKNVAKDGNYTKLEIHCQNCVHGECKSIEIGSKRNIKNSLILVGAREGHEKTCERISSSFLQNRGTKKQVNGE